MICRNIFSWLNFNLVIPLINNTCMLFVVYIYTCNSIDKNIITVGELDFPTKIYILKVKVIEKYN